MGKSNNCALILTCLFLQCARPSPFLKSMTMKNNREVTTFNRETPVTEYGNQFITDADTLQNEAVKKDSNASFENGTAPFPRPEAFRIFSGGGHRGAYLGGAYRGSGDDVGVYNVSDNDGSSSGFTEVMKQFYWTMFTIVSILSVLVWCCCCIYSAWARNRSRSHREMSKKI